MPLRVHEVGEAPILEGRHIAHHPQVLRCVRGNVAIERSDRDEQQRLQLERVWIPDDEPPRSSVALSTLDGLVELPQTLAKAALGVGHADVGDIFPPGERRAREVFGGDGNRVDAWPSKVGQRQAIRPFLPRCEVVCVGRGWTSLGTIG